MALGDELANVVRRMTDTYLGEDGPWEMDWRWRFYNALFGVVVFTFVGFATEVIPIRTDLNTAINETSATLRQVQSDAQEIRSTIAARTVESEFTERQLLFEMRALQGSLEAITGATTSDAEVDEAALVESIARVIRDIDYHLGSSFQTRPRIDPSMDGTLAAPALNTEALDDLAAAISALRVRGVLQLLVVADSYSELLAWMTVLSVGFVAVVIACGVTRGGPLRFFFLGVTVPALVTILIRNAVGLLG